MTKHKVIFTTFFNLLFSNALVTFGQPCGNFPAEQKTDEHVQKLFFSKPQ